MVNSNNNEKYNIIVKYYIMGNSGGSGCLYTNQGERIDDIRDQINNALSNSRNYKNSPISDLDAYFNNVISLYGIYDNNYNDYNDYLNKNPNNSNNAIEINNLSDNLIENQAYKFKSFSIPDLNDGANKIFDSNNDNNYEYFFYHKNDNDKGPIQKYFETGKYYETVINNQQQIIKSLVNHINNNYENINVSLENNKIKTNNINKTKGNIISQSHSISFFENLLIQSYKELYDAIYIENNVILNNDNMKKNTYSTDNSYYDYGTNKITFYKNINTFLFYFYYLLILIVIIIILLYNSELLTVFSIFHIFLLILILYPLYVLRFQNNIYSIFQKGGMYLYNYTQ